MKHDGGLVSPDLRNPRLVMTTSSREIVQRMRYDEFGNVILDSNPGFPPFGFAGGFSTVGFSEAHLSLKKIRKYALWVIPTPPIDRMIHP
jgi:hypothetical protein